jgi:hypothetical protein
MTQPSGEWEYLQRQERISRIKTNMTIIGQCIAHGVSKHIERNVRVVTGVRPKWVHLAGWSHTINQTVPLSIYPIWTEFTRNEAIKWGVTRSGELVRYCFDEVIGSDGEPVVRRGFTVKDFTFGLVTMRDVWRTDFLESKSDADLDKIEKGIAWLQKQGLLSVA